MTLLLSLLACDAGETSTLDRECPDPSVAPVVAACFAGPSVSTGTSYEPIEGSWSGIVADVGTRSFPAECVSAFGAEPTVSAWWARLDTAEGDVWVGFDTSGAVAPVVGETLTVSGYFRPGIYGPDEGAVELTDATSLRAWAGVSGRPEDLRAPSGFAFATGAVACSKSEECGDWAGYDLEVTVDGATETLEYDESRAIGSYPVTAAAVDQQIPDVQACPDWFVAKALVGVGTAAR
jgi:hypothetical protein